MYEFPGPQRYSPSPRRRPTFKTVEAGAGPHCPPGPTNSIELLPPKCLNRRKNVSALLRPELPYLPSIFELG